MEATENYRQFTNRFKTGGDVIHTFWRYRWENQMTTWHLPNGHIYLKKYKDVLTNNRHGIQIFFPLCGKCVEMRELYNDGHAVVGVEACEIAVKEFFDDQGLEFVVSTEDSCEGKLYQTLDGRLKIFCCDIFKFNKECAGRMDAVWDRAAMAAVERKDRKRYVNLMFSLLAPGFRYILVGLVYKDWFFAGPPLCVPEKLVYELYGDRCTVTLLDRRIVTEERVRKLLECKYVEELAWLLTDSYTSLHPYTNGSGTNGVK